MKAAFMNGNRKLTMKINRINEDGSSLTVQD